MLAVEWGGLTVLRLMRGRRAATAFQRTFARAGHAHTGVLVILALVSQILLDATELGGVPEFLARYGAAAAAAHFPAGFFLSSASRDAVGGVGAKGLGEPGRSAGGGCAQPALSAQ